MKRVLILLILWTFHHSGRAQDAEAKWTPDFQMSFKSIQGTSISPDGKYVAYVVRTPIMENDKSEYLSQIWVASTDGSFNEQYTRDEKSSYSPAFSPDGKSIAFLSSRSGKSQIWLMRLMGGEPRQVTHVKNGVNSFKWSPTGESFVFLQTDPPTAEEEKARKEKTDVILVDQNFKFGHLYALSATNESDSAKQLTSGALDIKQFNFSPDGKQIVFSYQLDPKINTGFLDSDIAIVPSDSGKIELLVNRKGVDSNPVFSPDGEYVAFETSNGAHEPIGLSDISLLELSSKKITALPQTPDRSASIIDWKDQKLYFAEVYRTSRVALALDIPKSGRSPEKELKVGSDNLVHDINGVGGGYSYSDNGLMSFAFESIDKPAEVFIKDLKSGELKQLSKVNSKVEIPVLAKTEIIKWKSNDGLEVEGLLTYPKNYVRGQRYPIILNVHGGPAGAFTQGFTGRPSIYMIQYFAENGYAVLRPNPRGSTGYGKDFRFANFMDWGFGDFEDLVSGVDHLIKTGVADKDNQFLMGWSYGGYMTSFAVTKTDRFNAASMGAGLPNLVSMTTTTDIPDYLVGHMGGEFWNDYETYEKHSAMYQIKNVKTPTQVIHGQNDLRVPFTQGQEFYVALKRMGVDTEMIVYPRTPHGPREPKFLMDVSPRILAWFEKYKK